MGCKMSLLSPSNYYSGEIGIQPHTKGFPGDSNGKDSACNVGGPMFHLWVGRFPGKGNGYPLQYSCLENFTDRGVWQATIHGVTKSQT